MMDGKKLDTNSLIQKIVDEYMASGKFDELRRKLLADVDTKAAYQNTRQTMHNVVRRYLSTKRWSPTLNKLQLRENLRKHLLSAPFLRPGVNRILRQVVNDSVMRDVRSEVESIANNILGIKKEEPMETVKDEPSENDTEMILDSPSIKEEIGLPTDTNQGVKEELVQDEIQIFEDVGVPGEEVIELVKSPTPLLPEEPPSLPIPSASIEEESMITEQASHNEEDEDSSDEESEHSITNQMSPISVGSPAPPTPEPELEQQPETEAANTSFGATKRASDFVGKIPKLKRGGSKGPNSGIDDEASPRKDQSSSDKNGVRCEESDDKVRERRDGTSLRDADRPKERESKENPKEKERSSRDKDGSRDRGYSDKAKARLNVREKDKGKSNKVCRNEESNENHQKTRDIDKSTRLNKGKMPNVDGHPRKDTYDDKKTRERSSISEKDKSNDRSSKSVSRDSRSSSRLKSKR